MTDKESIQYAAEVLRGGGVVLHATEGVWGFACDPFQPTAVEKILAIKGRQAAKGFIVIGAEPAAFADQLAQVSVAHRGRVQASWPGAHTWILPDDRYPSMIRGERPTLACRVPGHVQARALCNAFGATLVSTSANRSGEAPLTRAAQAEREFGAQVDYFLWGEVDRAGSASTIYGLQGEILRAGG